MKVINCGRKRIETLVDDEDFIRLGHYKWCVIPNKNKDKFYIHRVYKEHNKKIHIYLHREILNAAPGVLVDHINGDTLDNRRENLRLCNHQQNRANSIKHRTAISSKFKGPYYENDHFRNKPWSSVIRFKGKKIRLGCFETEIEAAKAYDKKAKEVFGEFARLNFPENN